MIRAVAVLWGTLLLTIALRHTSIYSCLAEVRRNSGLRLLFGIETPEAVPKAWNMSRFLKTLGEPQCLALLLDAFATLLAAHRRTPGTRGKMGLGPVQQALRRTG